MLLHFHERQKQQSQRHVFGEIAMDPDSPFHGGIIAGADPDLGGSAHLDDADRQQHEHQHENGSVGRNDNGYHGTPLKIRSFGSLSIIDIAAAVSAHPHVGLLGVGREAFENAQPRAIFADHRTGLVGHYLLIGAGLEEFADPEP